jgi:hypothetical protein
LPSFKQKPKHIHKQEQKTPLTIKEAQTRKKAHKKATKNSTLLSNAQPTSLLDQIQEILKHVEINALKPKFKRHNTAWKNISQLKTAQKTAWALLSCLKLTWITTTEINSQNHLRTPIAL